ncbi:MAG: AAA family ATPase [Nocardioidaceae bacterium]
MSTPRLVELRLRDFKSYADATLPLEPLTVLIGRNGSGKSNALDALEVLARLAQGDEVRDALDGGRRASTGVRGGTEGCARDDAACFSIGITVADASTYDKGTFWASLDVTIQVSPDVRIVAEEFEAYLPETRRKAVVLQSLEADSSRSDLVARIHNDRVGPNPHKVFRSTHLLSGQLPLRLDGVTAAERDIIAVAGTTLSTLASVFHLDPVPTMMRDYVSEQDSTLRRSAQNLSASVARLKHDDRESFQQLVSIAKELPESDVRGLDLVRGGLGDVMLALKEKRGRSSAKISSRQMSDGMLRMLAIATALLTGGPGLALDKATTGDESQHLCLVLEELENGLHPSQAARVLDLVKQASAERGFQVILTTHSPALLDALNGDDHPGVLLCHRDEHGHSVATRLTDLPRYLSLMASSRLGQAATAGKLLAAARPAPRPSSIDELLGIA